MSNEERRTVVLTTALLLGASLIRFAWEARPVPPILPPTPVPEALLEATRLEVEREERMATPLGPEERIDPNRDPEVELARLPGIGPALARRIVEDRESRGGFASPQDLLRVSGIGPATLARIEPHLALSAPTLIGVGPPPGGAADEPDPLRLDLNRAGVEDLQLLPGIGPALAERIVAHRSREGRFREPEDLLAVSGIGPATLARLLPLVRADR